MNWRKTIPILDLRDASDLLSRIIDVHMAMELNVVRFKLDINGDNGTVEVAVSAHESPTHAVLDPEAAGAETIPWLPDEDPDSIKAQVRRLFEQHDHGTYDHLYEMLEPNDLIDQAVGDLQEEGFLVWNDEKDRLERADADIDDGEDDIEPDWETRVANYVSGCVDEYRTWCHEDWAVPDVWIDNEWTKTGGCWETVDPDGEGDTVALKTLFLETLNRVAAAMDAAKPTA